MATLTAFTFKDEDKYKTKNRYANIETNSNVPMNIISLAGKTDYEGTSYTADDFLVVVQVRNRGVDARYVDYNQGINFKFHWTPSSANSMTLIPRTKYLFNVDSVGSLDDTLKGYFVNTYTDAGLAIKPISHSVAKTDLGLTTEVFYNYQVVVDSMAEYIGLIVRFDHSSSVCLVGAILE